MGMEATQYRIPDQKAYRHTARNNSLYSVGNACSALVTYDLYDNKLSSIVYAVATSLSLVPRISLRRRLAERPLSLSHPDWDFNESVLYVIMAERQNSLAVVLPGSTALSEIISCFRQKGVISTAKKGHLLS